MLTKKKLPHSILVKLYLTLSKYFTKSMVDFKIQEKNTFDLIDCNINYHF